MNVALEVDRNLIEFANEAKEFYLGSGNSVQEISTPSPVQYLRDFVSSNTPFVIRGAVKHWKAIKNWNTDYFKKTIPKKLVTVAVTPNGLADAVFDGKFVLPEERTMQFSEFLNILQNKNDNGVYYIQKQNSNLISEMPELIVDCESDIPWATEAFGKQPDAVNFWMGQGKAVTSMHKDPYENLYCVVKGKKTFTLHPPTDRPFIPYKNFPTAQYHYSDDGWGVRDCLHCDINTVPWIDINPLKPDYEKYPDYKHAHKIQCTLYSGDLLYLPSLWFHHVTQSEGTIAVNFWYDMSYDVKYSYFQLLNSLTKTLENKKKLL